MPFTPDILPAHPASPTHGIGIIGAGGIVQHGHLPAYRKAGFPVAGIASRTAESVARTADAWGIDARFTDWRALLDLPEVSVVDVTYPFDEERLEIVFEAAARGKHLLMQKPLAHSREAAAEMVRIAAEAGVKLAVNQNARWCPQYRAAWQAIHEGWVGDVYFVMHEMQNTQDSQAWFTARWYARQPRFQLLEYAIHHLDLMRFWTGQEPSRVTASVGRKPTQHSVGEMLVSVTLEFPGHALAVVVENNASHPHATPRSRFRIEGTKGMLSGEAMGDPHLTLVSDRLSAPVTPDLPGAWFPDAFIGTMGDLLLAIDEDRDPHCSGADNLKTLEIVFKAYESAGL
jgi:predicted dehydrogenase